MKCHDFLNLLNIDINLARDLAHKDNFVLYKKTGPGETPFHYCVVENNLKLASLLLDWGSDINTQDEFGATPLMHAVRLNYYEMVDFLISKHSDTSIKTVNGETALSYAVLDNNEIFTRLLLKHCSKPLQYYFEDLDAMSIVESPDNEMKLLVIDIGLKNPYE